MPSELPRMPLYLDETLKLKFEYIAYKNGRSSNSEARQLISRLVTQYEKSHGEIRFDYFCDRLCRPVVLEENGNCYFKVKCRNDDCRQRGGTVEYARKR